MPNRFRALGLIALLALLALVAPGAAVAQDDITQPADVTVMPGGTATFTTGAPGGLVYEWYRVATPADLNVKSSLNDATYSFVATAADDGARFYAKFLLNGRFVTTRTATLTVGDGSASIATPPRDATVLATRPVQFDVVARGTSPLSYRWQRSADGTTWSDIAGATAPRLRLRPAPADDGTLLRAVVDNTVGEPAISSAAKLTVLPLGGAAEPVAHASLEWGINPIYQGGNPAGNGCNFFSAGKTLDFLGRVGDVRIVHRTPAGLVSVSEGTKCANDAGDSLGQRALFTEGTGSANAQTGEATIQWKGAFTANAYSGLVPWFLEDPKLTVAADGTGTLKAIAGGKGAAMTDPDHPFDVKPREVVVATFQDVEVTPDGITVRPDYAGVDYFALVDGVRSTTSAITDAIKGGDPEWGAWPESFVDFHYETQLSTYWHSSGLSADPDKPPYPFAVHFAAAPPVVELPRVHAGPATTAATPFVEGRAVALTVDVEDATSLRWQRAASSTGPWTDVEDGETVTGATGETLTLGKVDAAWNGAYVRVRAVNDEGAVETFALPLTTKPYQPLAFTSQPQDAMTIAGNRVELHARASGHPAPVAAAYGVQVSHDGGNTWTAVDGVEWSEGWTTGDDFVLASVPASFDGALVRATARNGDGDVAASRPARLTVVPATGGPQLALSPERTLDPSGATTLTVVGAGFDLPDAPDDNRSYSLDLGVFTTAGWQPGRPGTREWLATSSETSSGQLYQGRLEESGGWFSVALTVPAGVLQPGAVHGVGAFLRLHDITTGESTYTNRAGDAWAGLALPGQARAAVAASPKDVTVRAGERVELAVEATGSPAPAVRWQRLGADGWTDLAGETAPTLAFVASAADDGARFRALADNRLGLPAASAPARVTIGVPDTPRGEPTPTPTPQAQPTVVPQATPTPAPTRRAALVVPKGSRRLAANRTATVGTIVCPAGEAACAVTTPKAVTVKIVGRRYTLSVVRVTSVRAGARAALRVRVPKSAALRLRGRTAKLTFTVKLTTAGHTTTTTVRTTLAGARR